MYLNFQFSENQSFQFFIGVKDIGPTSHYSVVPVNIYVMNVKDVPPLFERAEEMFFISEAAKNGTPITRLKILSNSNNTVTCRIVSSEKEFPFTIDKKTCTVSVASSLDREIKDSYIIGVLAETDTSPPLTSLAEITLKILDENDHSPVFESNPYSITVAENIEPGSSILKVTAQDKDLGSNSEVRYSLGSDVGNLANIFTVDTYTGWISTLIELDKENQSKYRLQVLINKII